VKLRYFIDRGACVEIGPELWTSDRPLGVSPPPETCAACHREVRWGTRGGRLAWWHQDDVPGEHGYIDDRVGHEPVFGTPSWATPALELPEDHGETDDRIFDIPEPEVYALPIDIGDPKMPGGASNLIKAVVRAGGTFEATLSRGPRVHGSHGNLLGISDYVVVKFFIDDRRAVARWEFTTKWALDTGYIVLYGRGVVDPDVTLIYPKAATAAEIRAWLLKWQGPLREEV
jgi:hypothetical protein